MTLPADSRLPLRSLLAVALTALATALGAVPAASAAPVKPGRAVAPARTYTAYAPGKGPARNARPARKVRGARARRREERLARLVRSRTAAAPRRAAAKDRRSRSGGEAPAKPRPPRTGPAVGSAIARGSVLTGPVPSILDGLSSPGLGPAGLRFEPDTAGAIGFEHYVEIVDGGSVGVFRRSDLGLVAKVDAPTFLGQSTGEVIDPQVIWDETTQRFFYSFSRPTPTAYDSRRQGNLEFGWSKTADPSDVVKGWCHLSIPTGSVFDDNPKLGDTATHLVITSSAAGPSGDFARVLTVPKPAAGTGCPSSVSGVQSFGSDASPLKSADGDKVDWPVPSIGADEGGTGYVLAGDRHASSTEIMAWTVSPTGALVQAGNLPVRAFAQPADAPQPSGYDTLDTQDGQLLQAVAVRDPAVGATGVWSAHAIADPAGGGRSVVRWYEIIPSRCSAGTCPASAVRQQGEVKDPANFVFNPAISPTAAGDEAVLHYNVAGAGQLAQVRMRSRGATSTLSDLGPEVVVETSDAADADASCGPKDGVPACRWGDYASATPDPNSDHVVWGSNMAIGPQTPGITHWKTRNFAVRPGPAPVLVHDATSFLEATGDGDGVPEPGETVDVRETVRNAGDTAATGVSGAFSSRTPEATLPGTAMTFPDVTPGARAATPSATRATIASTASCTQSVKLALTVSSGQGRHVVPVTVPLGAAATAPVSRYSADVPKTIPDNDPAGVTSALEVTDSGTVGDVDVTISGITHTWDGDLRLELIAPDGTTVLLADRPGGTNNSGDNLTGTVFDDEAPVALSAGTAPYTGRFRPQASLSALDGKSAKGTWRLRVADLSNLDKGTLNGWGTAIAPPAPAPSGGTPAPAPAPTPVSVNATDVPKAIPDNTPGGVVSSLSVAQTGPIGDLDVSVGITHGWVGDLKLDLVAPDGTVVPLADRPGGTNNGGDNFRGTVLDDEASTALTSGTAPYTGSFRPVGSLSALDGKSMQGTWQLRVSDSSALDMGTLDAWGLKITPPSPTGTPGPDVRSATDLPKAIPDNSTTGVTSTVSVPVDGKVSDLDVTVGQLRHTWDGDLRIELTGPDGTRAVLADRPGGTNNAGDDLRSTVFDDEAASVISAGTPPYTGAFRPQVTPLSVFDGKLAKGTWSLKVADLSSKDTGTLDAWGTRISTAAPGTGCG